MGGNRSNVDDVQKQHAQHLNNPSVPQVVYSGMTLEVGKFLHPALDVRYGGKRLSLIPQGMSEAINMLCVNIGLDVTGSNALVAKLAHQDFPQFWELLKFLLPDGAFHINVQMGAIDDYPSDADVVQLSQWEGDGLTLENVLRVLYPVGQGYGNGKEAYALYLWLLLHFNDLEIWKQGKKGIVFVLFDEGIEDVFYYSRLYDLFERIPALNFSDGLDSGPRISEGMRQPTNLQLPPRDGSIAIADLVAQVKQKYHIFPVHCSESYASYGLQFSNNTYEEWKRIFGAESVLKLSDARNVSELVASVTARLAGVSRGKIMNAIEAGNTLVGTGKREVEYALDLVRGGTQSLVANDRIKRL